MLIHRFIIALLAAALLELPALPAQGPVRTTQAAQTPPTATPPPTPSIDADLKAQADQRSEEALLLYQEGDLHGALDAFNQTLELYRQAGDRAGEATTLSDIGSVHYGLGQYFKAIELFQQALAVMRDLGDRASEGTILNNIGLIQSSLGNYIQALETLQQALTIQREVGNRAGEGSTLGNIALIYDSLGEYAQTLAYCEEALAILRELGDRATESIILNNVGTTYHRIGQPTKALEHYLRSLAIVRELGDRAGEGVALSNLAAVYDSLGDDTKALEHYLLALALRRSIGDRAGEGNTLNNIGFFYAHRNQPARALEYYQLALAASRETGDRASEALTINNLGEVYARLNQDARALELFQQALALAREQGHRFNESKALANIGRIYEKQDKLQQALELYQQALAVEEHVRTSARLEELKASLSERTAGIHARAALLFVKLGQPEQAFSMAEQARARTFLDQLGNARVDIRKGVAANLIHQEQDLRRALAELERALSQERAWPRAQQNLEVIRTLNDQLNAKERDYEDLLTRIKLSNPEYASMVSIATLTLTETQAALDPDTTLLDYFVTVSNTLAFIITRDSFQVVTLPVGEQALQASIAEFRRFDSLDDPAPSSLRSLYAWLIAPLQENLKTDRVGIVPHGPLHYLPFTTLPMVSNGNDGQDAGKEGDIRYLGDEHTFFYLPSASVLPFLHTKQKETNASDVLAFSFAAPSGFEPLAYANQEAQDIAALFDTRPLIGANASELAFKRRAGEHRIVHVAAHGEFNLSNAQFSRLLLSPEQDDDGSVEVHEVYGLELEQTDLVVLSACETQLGRQSKGDDIVAFNRAFLYAGTPTVIASLWAVNDEATSVLMQSFYKHLKQGDNKAEALRQAQRETRARFPHPYYWAAFVLTGSPGTSPTAPNSPLAVIAAAVVIVGLALSAGLVILRRRARPIRTN